MNYEYVTAMLKGRTCEMALNGGNAQSGRLQTVYDGVPPQHKGYTPRKLEGGIILGTGGDNSLHASGTFFEGVMTTGYASAATDDAIHANIVAAGYGRQAL